MHKMTPLWTDHIATRKQSTKNSKNIYDIYNFDTFCNHSSLQLLIKQLYMPKECLKKNKKQHSSVIDTQELLVTFAPRNSLRDADIIICTII